MVFVDSNVPMYVAGGEHPLRDRALRFLTRARAGEIELCTSTEVLQEILYRYIGLGRPDMAEAVYDLFVAQCAVVYPVTLAETDRAKRLLRGPQGISVRDAVHAAVMIEHQLVDIATFDRGFDRVPGIARLDLA